MPVPPARDGWLCASCARPCEVRGTLDRRAIDVCRFTPAAQPLAASDARSRSDEHVYALHSCASQTAELHSFLSWWIKLGTQVQVVPVDAPTLLPAFAAHHSAHTQTLPTQLHAQIIRVSATALLQHPYCPPPASGLRSPPHAPWRPSPGMPRCSSGRGGTRSTAAAPAPQPLQVRSGALLVLAVLLELLPCLLHSHAVIRKKDRKKERSLHRP